MSACVTCYGRSTTIIVARSCGFQAATWSLRSSWFKSATWSLRSSMFQTATWSLRSSGFKSATWSLRSSGFQTATWSLRSSGFKSATWCLRWFRCLYTIASYVAVEGFGEDLHNLQRMHDPAQGSNCSAVQSCVRGDGFVAFVSDYVASQPTPLTQATPSLCSSSASMSLVSSDLVAHFPRRGRLPPRRCRLLTAACASSVLCLEELLTSQECAHTFHDVRLQEWAIAKVWGHIDSCRRVLHVLRQYSALLCCSPYMSSKIDPPNHRWASPECVVLAPQRDAPTTPSLAQRTSTSAARASAPRASIWPALAGRPRRDTQPPPAST